LRFFIVVVTAISFLVTGCSIEQGTKKREDQQPITTTLIDWVNFIKFHDITYQAIYQERLLDATKLGPLYEKVKFKLADNVHDPNYKSKNGDAAFLSPGTAIYALKDYKPEFRLGVLISEGIGIYEADTNPKAKTGADLLDIGDKVDYIGINSVDDGTTEIASIKNSNEIASFVDMVLKAPVDQNQQNMNNASYFISFHLKDGSTVNRAYWPDSGELSRGILLPSDFRVVLENALKKKRK